MANFKKILEDFDDAIVQRGKIYYREGRVIDLQEIFPGEYRATVRGVEDYTVFVALDHDEACSFDCDCPYSDAPYCKHVVAVLLAIEAKSVLPRSKSEKASQTKSESLDVLLAGLPKDKLVALILDIASAFPSAKSWLKAHMSLPKDEIAAYRQMIRQVADSCMHDHFIGYLDMDDALRGAEDALAHLEEMILSPADIMQTLDFALMIVEETLSIMDSGDDSDGDASWIISSCLEALEHLFSQRLFQEDADTWQNYCHRLMHMVQSPMLCGLGSWNELLIDQCVRIADRLPALREELLQYQLHKMASGEDKEDSSSQLERQKAQEAYFALLARWGEEEAARAFAAEHMDNDAFRIYFYENYLQQKQFDKAIDLCLQAEEACGPYPGLYRQWQKRRYDVYVLSADQDAQKQLGEALLLEGEDEFYPLLKKLYSPDAWSLKRAELLDQLYQRRQHTYLHIITDENDKQRLIAYVRANPTCVFALYDHLLPDYAGEIQDLFLSAITIMASRATDRKAYQNVCRHLRIVSKACGKRIAIALIHELQRAYPRKSAFQDELQKLLKQY